MSKELIIENTTIVTMNHQREILTNVSLAIRGERIGDIGSAEDVRKHYPGISIYYGRVIVFF